MSLLSLAWTRHAAKPGAVVFAMLFAMDSLARASLATVIPLEALRLLGNARDVSALFSAVGWIGIGATLFVPALVRRFRPRWVYTGAVLLLMLAPLLLWTGSLPGLAAGMLVRVLAAAFLLNLLNLYIMAYIRKKDLSRSEPLRTFFSAGAWVAGPLLGVLLFTTAGPWAAYGLSAGCALLLLGYFWWLRLEYGPVLGPDEPAPVNPFRSIGRYLAQPRLVLAWLLNFGRETWWVMFFIYAPVHVVNAGWSKTAGAALVSAGTACLFASPALGWLARRVGLRRFLIAAFLWTAAATAAVALALEDTGLAAAGFVAAALGASALDAAAVVPFLRAVRARERPEMTMVFSLYRDAAGLLPPALFAVLLTFLPLPSVFAATGIALMLCAWLARWIPRGM